MNLNSVVGAGWLLFLAYWWISAVGVKKSVRRPSWKVETAIRVVAVAVIVLLVRAPSLRAFLRPPPVPNDSLVQGAGLAICFAGFALAVWARRHLGRNWGMPMTLKEGHDLVTTGPYRYVRHPIYTGMLVAMLGSALVAGRLWLAVLLAMFLYCLYSARVEEGIMLRQFPAQYAEYKRRTKALIPFVL